MNLVSHYRGCAFCVKFGNMTSDERNWYDVELTSLGDFVVVPALGALIEGHLMIVTRNHYQSMAYLSEGELVQLSSFVQEVREVLSDAYNGVVVFEHGPALPMHSGGSCIDHAHLQVIPLKIDLLPDLLKCHACRSIGEMRELIMLRHQTMPYFFYQNQLGQMYVSQPADVPSQYMRRLIAAVLEKPDEWDYALFPNFELIEATVRKMTPWPIQRRF
jgi:hypothetical protein